MLRWLAALALVVVGLLLGAGTAWADGGGVAVQCQRSDPHCTVSATDTSVLPAAQASVHPEHQSKGGPCHAPDGTVMPCTDPQFGWLGSDGCYWKVDTGYQPPATDTADQHSGHQGAWFDFTCPGTSGTGGGLVWLPTAAPAAAPPPAPAVLARQAANQFGLAPPAVVTSPPVGGDLVVGVPTWLWVDPAAWHAVSASAAVPGEAVTATATPTSITWVMGDGTTVTCTGPGTPYRAGADAPEASSPTCGHTYTTSSATQPGGAYTVTATVTWNVSWAGGGQAGVLPALTTTTTLALRVAEVQGLNTGTPATGK